jgi:N-acetylmuramoyl-L-alanine amidase
MGVSRRAAPGATASVRVELERPEPGGFVHGGEMLLGFGWVLADTPVLGMDVALGDQPLCEAVTGQARADIARWFPGQRGAGNAGFSFIARLPAQARGAAELRLSVYTAAGETVHRVPVRFEAGVDPEPPALEPVRLELEEARLEPGGTLHVRGWALTLAATQSVEVRLGGHSLGLAHTLLSREDVGAAHPDYPHAGTAGFALRCEVPAALAGERQASAIVTDANGRTRAASVALTGAAAAAPDPGALGPGALAPMRATLEEARIDAGGVLRVRGWAVSLAPVRRVRVYLDDKPLGTATLGLPREDVALAFPGYPDAGHAGFLLQQDIARPPPPAGRTVRVSVTAAGGIRRELTAPLVVAAAARRRARPAGDGSGGQ